MGSIGSYKIHILECSVGNTYHTVKFTVHSREFESAGQTVSIILRKLYMAAGRVLEKISKNAAIAGRYRHYQFCLTIALSVKWILPM